MHAGKSCSDKRGEGAAHWKSLLSLLLEDLWRLIKFPGCGAEYSPALLGPGNRNLFILALSLFYKTPLAQLGFTGMFAPLLP